MANASADGRSWTAETSVTTAIAGSEGGVLSNSRWRSRARPDRWSAPVAIDTVASTPGAADPASARRNGTSGAFAAPRSLATPVVPEVRGAAFSEADRQVRLASAPRRGRRAERLAMTGADHYESTGSNSNVHELKIRELTKITCQPKVSRLFIWKYSGASRRFTCLVVGKRRPRSRPRTRPGRRRP